MDRFELQSKAKKIIFITAFILLSIAIGIGACYIVLQKMDSKNASNNSSSKKHPDNVYDSGKSWNELETLFKKLGYDNYLSMLMDGADEFDKIQASNSFYDINYADECMWVYKPQGAELKYDTDVFFLCPTAIPRDWDFNLKLDDDDGRSLFADCVNIEKGIYDDAANFYAPYYRQMSLGGYTDENRESYLQLAYEDVREAFSYYLCNLNGGRNIVLAGFSQGSDMQLRLLEEMIDEFEDRFVAAYAIGWNVTDEYLNDNPKLKMATGEMDTGVIVSFCSESEDIKTSVIVPDSTNGINPLNWKTDSTKAGPELNKGSVFYEYGSNEDGSPKESREQLCGAYIDEERGTLKVTDLKEAELFQDPEIYFLDPGNYHKYDHEFFYRNLEDNVKKRIAAYNNR